MSGSRLDETALPFGVSPDSPFRVNGAFVSRTGRRIGVDLAALVALGLFMAVVGPYGTDDLPTSSRLLYWLACIVGGGAVGVEIHRLLERRIRRFWPGIIAVSLLMTPPVTAWVALVNSTMSGRPIRLDLMPILAWRVLVICLLVMTVRALLWRRVVETRTVVVEPMPEAERAFRQNLSAPRRGARILAIEAEDHYVRAHTDRGPELLSMRFADALSQLALVRGHRLHRSWWAAADAIESVRWTRGGGEALLAGGITAPVSRTYASDLKQAGWK